MTDMNDRGEVYELSIEVGNEVIRAMDLFPEFNSAHEGYAILKEEVDELWDEIKNNKDPEANARQRKEAVQVAAMAIRFVIDISDKGKYKNDR